MHQGRLACMHGLIKNKRRHMAVLPDSSRAIAELKAKCTHREQLQVTIGRLI